ncbi:c-type cytochrome [Solwaraspora sp. WMMD791]|uniref:cytochrome bc1 complex diheme cytochrome c subunit n=1 Tax=Solwaraspora sp. WMMD791 TaxID=3016086 RepID=UPI00249BEF45|nr:c-type cytochrome [Solwaraspora sp. WMMD791]WFE26064.1 c-type cytochrome [Solwaraspora sp. WMMD791]
MASERRRRLDPGTLRGRPSAGAGSRVRRRLGTAARLLAALVLAGGFYAAFVPSARAQEDEPRFSGAAAAGEELFEVGCISCHGRNAGGVEGRGPSLVGVGAASVEFQVGTGRMPLARQEAQALPKPPQYSDEEILLLAAYVQELGGGPVVPALEGPLADADLALGGRLFRLNCAQCHAFGGGGGALSSGKYAPGLRSASERTIYAAMLSGPQSMPVFGDSQLTPQEKADIIAYIQQVVQDDRDPGGLNLGRYGPSTEGLAIFLVGVVALVFASLWIAGKS